MPAEAQTGANITLAANVLLYAYVVLAVLKQSDAELILPSSTFDLGGLLDKAKDGIPGGSFVAPLLQVQIPLTVFYTLGPLALLALHGFVVLDGRLLREAATPLRVLAVWLPPLTLALIRWRFAPYVSARPEPPLSGVVLEQLQVVALALDMALVLFALRCARIEQGPEATRRARWRAALARALREAAMVWLAILLGNFLVGSPQGWAGLALAVAVALAGIGPRMRRRLRKPPDLRNKELPMRARVGVAVVFVVFAALPAFARSLDLSGQSLVAQAPTEAMITALVSAPGWKQQFDELTGDGDARLAFGDRITLARQSAWLADGRGIDLARWKFPAARFDGATVAHIDLDGATLTNASFDNANVIGASLRGAKLTGSSWRYVQFLLVQAAAAPPQPTSAAASEAAPQPLPGPQDPTASLCPSERDRTDFSGADLTGADLTGADLTCARLRGVTLSGTVLSGAILKDVDLCGAQMQGADLSTVADLSGASLDYADLQHAILPKKMSNAYLRKADVRGTTMAGSPLALPPDNRLLTSAHAAGAVVTAGRYIHLQDCPKLPARGK